MSDQFTCPDCGAKITSGAPMGLCEACLLKLAMEPVEAKSQGENAHKSTIALSFPLTEKPGDRIGRYKLLEQIGEGGCGVVYMVEQEEPIRRRVALKVIKPGMDSKQVLARFEAERQALAVMDHPNIAKVLDAGATEKGRPYFVMELVRGIPITRYCDENKLSTKARLELFAQVCQAIQHAHQKGIIHRDIKPSNILIADHDGTPVPKIIDFGIAKATAGQTLTNNTLFTSLDQFIGTPAYMSPEQAKLSALDIDTRSDIYSLGVLLYELLTGKTPFEAKRLFEAGFDEIRRIIREEEPQRPSARISTLDAGEQTTVARQRQSEPQKLLGIIRGDLDWIVMKTLEKDRTRRYETANGLAMDIKRYLENEPVVARPPSNLYRLQKMVRRNKLAVTAASAVIAALLIGLGVSSWSYFREREDRQRALIAEKKARAEAQRADQHAAQEAIQRQRAVNSQLEIELQRAEDLFVTDSPSAVAHLARVLGENPTNLVAAQRLISALTQRSFALPAVPPIRVDDELWCAKFSPDGTRLLTSAGSGMIWDAHTGEALAGPLRHQKPLRYGEFSPDGQRVVTASFDSTARVWDAHTGQPLTGPLQHSGRVFSARFSPDGDRIVTASADNKARIWDTHTGKLLREFKHNNQVRDAEFSPDGKRVVTASWDSTSRVWDAQTGDAITEPLQSFDVNSAMFSPDGTRIVTASEGGEAWVWNAYTGQHVGSRLSHNSYVSYAEFSPDGSRILTCSWDSTARVWDARTSKEITPPLRHDGVIYFAQFSPDGHRIVTASEDNTARVWDAKTGKPLTQPLNHGSEVRFAQFSPDGQRVVTASKDKTARIWDLSPGESLPAILKHNAAVPFAKFDPDGRRIVTIDRHFTAQVWNALTGKSLTAPFMLPDRPELMKQQRTVPGFMGLVCADFSPDGKRLATASWSYSAEIWNPQSGEALVNPLDIGDDLVDVQFSSDGRWLLTASWHGTVRIWDTITGQPLFKPIDLKTRLHSAQFSPDGQRILTASFDSSTMVWDVQTGQPLLKEPIMHRGKMSLARFSPDGHKIVTASEDRTARIWDASTGQPLTNPLQHRSVVAWAEFSPDSTRVVTASWDKTARIWDATTGLPVGKELMHDDFVCCAEFSLDGQNIITASIDHTARIWDANTGHQLSEPFKHDADVNTAQFSPDGRWAVTASYDGTARVWEVPDSQLPIPAWLPELAEGVVNQRINSQGLSEPVSFAGLLKIQQEIKSSSATDYYTHWAKWFFADRRTRTISPNSPITVPEYIQRQHQQNVGKAPQEP